MAENKAHENLNTVTVIGTLTRDGELKKVGDNFNILNLSLANNYIQKKGDKYEQQVNYFDVKLFGKAAEALAKYLVKGTKIAVSGKLRQERWTDKNTNKTASRVCINADSIDFCGGKRGGNSTASAPSGQPEFPEDIPSDGEGIPF